MQGRRFICEILHVSEEVDVDFTEKFQLLIITDTITSAIHEDFFTSKTCGYCGAALIKLLDVLETLGWILDQSFEFHDWVIGGESFPWVLWTASKPEEVLAWIHSNIQ